MCSGKMGNKLSAGSRENTEKKCLRNWFSLKGLRIGVGEVGIFRVNPFLVGTRYSTRVNARACATGAPARKTAILLTLSMTSNRFT